MESAGETRRANGSGEVLRARRGDERSGTGSLMEEVVERTNLKAALRRVKQNKGGPGIDGMTVGELPDYLKREWVRIREELLGGTYQPQAVRRQTIPKAGGGQRELGIPTVLDRFIQQAVLQVLQPRLDPNFSDHSYGFRPGRRAHQAIARAQQYVQEGRKVVADVDLAKFFDRANHDIVMERLSRKIADKRVLGLIRRYLEAGVMVSGVVVERHEGTPQGGPLSPLLANVLLDEVDKELERRGHAFVRYADDLNVYVRSQKAGRRVYEGLKKLFGKLRLVVNEEKSAVDLAVRRDFLGYSFWVAAEGRNISPRVRARFHGPDEREQLRPGELLWPDLADGRRLRLVHHPARPRGDVLRHLGPDTLAGQAQAAAAAAGVNLGGYSRFVYSLASPGSGCDFCPVDFRGAGV